MRNNFFKGLFLSLLFPFTFAIAGKEQDNALRLGILEANKDKIVLALGEGADLNYQSGIGSPLYIAILRGNLEIVQLLVERGAAITADCFKAAHHHPQIESYLNRARDQARDQERDQALVQFLREARRRERAEAAVAEAAATTAAAAAAAADPQEPEQRTRGSLLQNLRLRVSGYRSVGQMPSNL